MKTSKMNQEMKPDLKKSHGLNGNNESMSWFGAFVGGGLLAVMMTLISAFLGWFLGVGTGAMTASSVPIYMGSVIIGCWVPVSFILWKIR